MFGIIYHPLFVFVQSLQSIFLLYKQHVVLVIVSYLHVKIDEQDNKCNHVAGLKEQAAQRKTTGENHCT